MTNRIGVSLVATVLPALLTAYGCANYKAMSREQQVGIRSVSVAQTVALPDHPVVFGPSTNSKAMFFGPLALMAARSSDNPDSQALKNLFETQQIDVGKILRQEFIACLGQSGAFPEVDVPQGDATFELTVEEYGLGSAGFTPFSPINHPLNPAIKLAGKLTSRGGELLWENSASLLSLNDQMEGYPFEEILAKPEQTREMFTKAAQIVSRDLLKDFGTDCVLAPIPTRKSPSKWVDIKDANELRVLYSNKTFRAKDWVVYSRADGRAVLIRDGRSPEPRIWEIEGNDRVCTTPVGQTRMCWRFQRNQNKPNQFFGMNMTTGLTVIFTLEDGIPEF